MRLFVRLIAYALTAIAATGSALSAFAQQDVITTVVGNGPNGIPALNANLYYPQQLAVDAQGNTYVAAYYQNRVFKIGSDGTITLIAGAGVAGYSGDGGLATAAQLYYPQGVAVDNANPANVYIADTSNCLVRKVSGSTGIITTVAGLVNTPDGSAPYPSCGYLGDGDKANAAELYQPIGLAINPSNNDLYIAEYQNGVVRKVSGGSASGTISTIAGSGGSTTSGNNCQGSAPFGDGAAANQAYLCYPAGVALDTSVSPANVFITESSSICDVREVVGSSKKIYQVAGSYSLGCGFTDNVKATSGQLYAPQQLAVQISGSTTKITVADYNNYVIRQFSLTYSGGVPKPGTITTIAGNHSSYSGDGGPALSAGITQPTGIAYDSSGNYFLAGQSEQRVRKVTKSSGIINTVAGWGQPSYSDPVGISGVPGGGVSLYNPTDVFADPLSSKVYVGGYYGQADYLWDSSTTKVTQFAGNGIAGYAGDGALATDQATQLSYPQGVVKDSAGNVYISDSQSCVIRKVSASTGKISTVVGGTNNTPNGCGYSGDGGAATAAQIYQVEQLAIDSADNLYLADYYNCLVRKVSHSTNKISTVAGLVTTVSGVQTASNCGYSGDGGSATSAQLYYASGVAVDGFGNIYIADYQNNRIRRVDGFTGVIDTVAGSRNPGYSGDGRALQASLSNPQRIAVDTNGNLFIADYSNNLLRWVDPGGQLTTFAGTPQSYGFGGDGGLATSALMGYPLGITQDAGGNFYVVDSGNNLIRKITAFAGYGRSTSSLSFGDVPAGTVSDYQSIYLSAIGPVTIGSITMPVGFAEIDDCSGSTLTAGQTCEIDVSFTPTTTGNAGGVLKIASNAFFPSQGSTVELEGRGTGLTLSGSLAFGTSLLKTPSNKTVTLSNGGASTATLKKIYLTQATDYSVTGGSCPAAGGTLAAGANCTIVVTFSPQSIGSRKSTLVIASNDPASPLLAGATGTGNEVKLSSSSLAFAQTTYGTTEVLNLTITNLGTNTLTVSPAISGTGAAAFSVLTTGNTCSAGTAAGKSCTLPVQFKPAAIGSFTASLKLTTNGGSSPTLALTGTDVAAVTVTPGSISFTTITHGTTETTNLTIKNVGTTSRTISTAISGSGASAYSIPSSGNTCTSTLAGGASCTLPVKFSPAAAITYVGTLTVTTNGGTNPAISLTGAGK